MATSTPHSHFFQIVLNTRARLASKLNPLSSKQDYSSWLSNARILGRELETLSTEEERLDNTRYYLNILRNNFPRKVNSIRQVEIAERFLDSRVQGIETLATVGTITEELSKPVPGSYFMRAKEYISLAHRIIRFSLSNLEENYGRLDEKLKRKAEIILFENGKLDFDAMLAHLGIDTPEASLYFKGLRGVGPSP
ncbi:MAG: hypothetical protein AABX11_02845 [Nanoarchaeota archaeon]